MVDRLGGAEAIAASARETKAFRRARGVPGAVALLRLALAYYLRQGGLRSTAAWASAVGLADISNVALLNRLRGCGATRGHAPWMAPVLFSPPKHPVFPSESLHKPRSPSWKPLTSPLASKCLRESAFSASVHVNF